MIGKPFGSSRSACPPEPRKVLSRMIAWSTGMGRPRDPYRVEWNGCRISVGGAALAKATRYDRARKAWRAGLAGFPESAQLKEHLAFQDDQALLAYIESKRSLQNPIDTSLSFLDREP